MEDYEDLKSKIEELSKENSYLKQEIRGLKKQIRKAMPRFKMEYNMDIHNIVIYNLDSETLTYSPYIIFNSDIPEIDNDFTKYIAEQVYSELTKNSDENELAL